MPSETTKVLVTQPELYRGCRSIVRHDWSTGNSYVKVELEILLESDIVLRTFREGSYGNLHGGTREDEHTFNLMARKARRVALEQPFQDKVIFVILSHWAGGQSHFIHANVLVSYTKIQ